jgi:rhodanese-related sulfurtransferase
MDNLEFETLTPEEFDAYLKQHQEKDYLLIDVRQESEYELGHIPGAKLMPLTEIEYAAYDLYRVMAEADDIPEAGETFLAIAQAEKGHMRALARAIEKCQW